MPWWAWLIIAYIVGGAIYLIAVWPRDRCPHCCYPLYKCECDPRDNDDGANVERVVRGPKKSKR